MCHLGRGDERLAGEQHCTIQPLAKKNKSPLKQGLLLVGMQEFKMLERSVATFICNPDRQPAKCLPFKPGSFAYRDLEFLKGVLDVRDKSDLLKTALFPALLIEGSTSSQPCQCKSDVWAQISFNSCFLCFSLGSFPRQVSYSLYCFLVGVSQVTAPLSPETSVI